MAPAQTPTGTITGIVTDPAGASVVGARIGVANRQTGQVWALTTSTEGIYTAAGLLSGSYQITAEADGLKRLERTAIVEAGTTTQVDITLELGEVSETVTVPGAAPLLRYDHHQVGGVVKREQIENLPLNGRNFLELAKLEPGVTHPVRGTANRTFVSALGSGLQSIPRVGYTRVTMDGANINLLAAIGTGLQVSSEVVQEFQLSTVSFDASTGLTTNGAINIVTRSGGNDFRGSGFFFHRDHNLAAYPALRRDLRDPDPFFERRQFGSSLGGPADRDRAFFFTSYERNEQRGVVSVQPNSPDLASHGGIFPSLSLSNQFSGRTDVQLHPAHHLFFRYTHDGNRGFAPASEAATNVLPSGWLRQTYRADQSVAGLASILSSRIVNDLRLAHFFARWLTWPADSSDCSGCFGVGAPRVIVAGAGFTFGTAPLGGSTLTGHRFQLNDNLVWQLGRHQLRFGFNWEHTNVRDGETDDDRLQVTLWSPQRVRQANQSAPPEAQIALPPSFAGLQDVLQLPLQSFGITVGPGRALERDFQPIRRLDLYRVHAADTWRVRPRLTLNLGLGWSYEPNAFNHDLTKPALLAPLIGEKGLRAPTAQMRTFSPTLGFAWTTTSDAKTVLRGGIGRYFDPAHSTNITNRATERWLLSPLGTGRVNVSGSNILWNGRPLAFLQPTPFTGAQLLAILPGFRDDLARLLNPENRDFAVRNINRTKEGQNLHDPSYELPSATHFSMGVQRELGNELVVSADLVWRHFTHTFINGIDYNRFNSAHGPVIPACTEAQRDDVQALCSNGSLMFDTTTGRARYKGLLLRAEKRVARQGQLLASYALGSYVGSNATGTGTAEMSSGRATGFNNDNWFENYGQLPTDLRHVLNVSGYLNLPWRFQLAINVSTASRSPFTAWLEDVDFNGDGTNDDLLPGTRVNEFGRGLDRDDLMRLVDRYNQEFAGKRLCCSQGTSPRVTLPDDHSFNDNFFTTDLRVTHTILLDSEQVRLLVFAEVFNLFNTANLVQYSGNLLDPGRFGQPGGRFTQIFGSGGPRAVQLGARVNF